MVLITKEISAKRRVNIYNEDVKVHLSFPKKFKEKKYALEREDVLQLLRFMNDRYKTLFMFLSCTGCRIGESVALRKSDFNVSKDRITVMLPAHITKTRESRITFVSKEVEPLLLELLNKKGKDELVFGTHQVPKYSKDSITQMFGIIRKNAGFCSCSKDGKDNCMGKYKSSPLHKITIHSFRAFFIKNINRVDFGLGYITPGYCAESEFSNELRVQKYDCPSFDSKSEKSITDSQTTQNNCDPLYPDFCIPSSPPDLDCKDISQKRFTVIQPDPHRFDADRDGIGCESG